MWSYNYVNDWGKKYEKCRKNGDRVAPIDIDIGRVAPCNELCRLAINYSATKASKVAPRCYISLVNDNPTVTFDPGNIIKFRRDFYFLRRMTLHNPSMHTINGVRYDLEILLYHQKNRVNVDDGGVIFSILLKKGVEYGDANEFLNEFINQLPTQETKIEKELEVSPEWSPLQILPANKSFFYYEGMLPYPPCGLNWTLIVFEEVVSISQNVIDTIKFLLGGIKNIRPIQPLPPTAVIYYNNAVDFDSYEIKEDDTELDTVLRSNLNLLAAERVSRREYINQKLYYIKLFIMLVVIILLICLSVKLAKYIVVNDYLNKFMLGQLQKKQQRDAAAADAAASTESGESLNSNGSNGSNGSEVTPNQGGAWGSEVTPSSTNVQAQEQYYNTNGQQQDYSADVNAVGMSKTYNQVPMASNYSVSQSMDTPAPPAPAQLTKTI
jgi:carbonic anhydrase